MEDFVYYGELYDLYQGLLTEKQKKYFENYYFDNLSLGEMSDAYDVSRNAIFKQIHITVAKLEEYEDALHLYLLPLPLLQAHGPEQKAAPQQNPQ